MSRAITFRKPQRRLPYAMGRLQAQRGVVLIITLIVLVAMILASIAMIRSVDTSTVIAGNLTFKQSAAASGDVGMEQAITWLELNGALGADSAGAGYYATSQDGLDLMGNKTPGDPSDDLDWTNANVVRILPRDAATGNQQAYVIHRMCDEPGPLDAGKCSVAYSKAKGYSSGLAGAGSQYTTPPQGSASLSGYYRITVRISGPKNTASYVQSIVQR